LLRVVWGCGALISSRAAPDPDLFEDADFDSHGTP
jgi:hypothetical protein